MLAEKLSEIQYNNFSTMEAHSWAKNNTSMLLPSPGPRIYYTCLYMFCVLCLHEKLIIMLIHTRPPEFQGSEK